MSVFLFDFIGVRGYSVINAFFTQESRWKERISVRNALILLSFVKNDISRQDQWPVGGFLVFKTGESQVCAGEYPVPQALGSDRHKSLLLIVSRFSLRQRLLHTKTSFLRNFFQRRAESCQNISRSI